MLAALITIIVLAAILEVVTLIAVPKLLTHSVSLSSSIVEQGEQFDIIAVITNRGILPVNYIRITETIPRQISIDVESVKSGISGGVSLRQTEFSNKLTSSAYLMPYQRLTRRIPITAVERGCFLFGSTHLLGGDFLGLSAKDLWQSASMEVVALPRPYECEAISKLLGGYLGDVSVRRFILEDPVLTLGFRDYTGNEPQKQIAWAQTARTGAIMVKKYDYTLEATASVLVNIEHTVYENEGNCRKYDDAVEKCFSAARSVCEYLDSHGIKYCFRSNISSPGARHSLDSIPDGLGNSHLFSILEGLGRAVYVKAEPFVNILARSAHSAESGRSFIIITPEALDEYTPFIRMLENISGVPVLVMEVAKL